MISNSSNSSTHKQSQRHIRDVLQQPNGVDATRGNKDNEEGIDCGSSMETRASFFALAAISCHRGPETLAVSCSISVAYALTSSARATACLCLDSTCCRRAVPPTMPRMPRQSSYTIVEALLSPDVCCSPVYECVCACACARTLKWK